MTSSALRRARMLVPAVELVVISLVLLPWRNATGSDGPRDGESWSWNLLGGPLLPPPASMLVWLAAVAVVCITTWIILSRGIRSREDRAQA